MNDQGPIARGIRGTFDWNQWRAEVERLLKGAPFAKKMFTRTLEGIQVGSMATAADRPITDWPEPCPARRPSCGAAGTPTAGPGWWPRKFRCRPAGIQRGPCPRPGAGADGGQPDPRTGPARGGPGSSTGIGWICAHALDWEWIWANTPVLIQAGAGSLPGGRESAGPGPGARVWIPVICAAGWAVIRWPDWPSRGICLFLPNKLYDELADLTRWAAGEAPGLKTLPVFEDPWHDGGADGALGLGLILATAVHALREMESRGLPVEEAAARIQFNLCVGSDFFMEIARLRALRVLWSRILTACGVDPASAPIQVHARTSRRTGTVLDPHVNMLRATTQAMSAVLGGVDSLHVAPFDEATGRARRVQPPHRPQRPAGPGARMPLRPGDRSGRRILVRGEADGRLAARAWERFQEIEAAGGIMAAPGERAGPGSGWPAAADGTRRTGWPPAARCWWAPTSIPDPNPADRTSRPATVRALNCPQGGHRRLQTRTANPFEDICAPGSRATGQRRRPRRAGSSAPAWATWPSYMPRLDFTRRFFRVGGFEVAGDGFCTTADEAVGRRPRRRGPDGGPGGAGRHLCRHGRRGGRRP